MTDPDRQVWDNMLAHLRSQHPKLCRQWFESIEPVCVSDGSFFVRAHNATHARYLRGEDCIEAFNDALRTASNRLLGIRFLGPDDSAPDHAGRGLAPAPASHGRGERGGRAGGRGNDARGAAGRGAGGEAVGAMPGVGQPGVGQPGVGQRGVAQQGVDGVSEHDRGATPDGGSPNGRPEGLVDHEAAWRPRDGQSSMPAVTPRAPSPGGHAELGRSANENGTPRSASGQPDSHQPDFQQPDSNQASSQQPFPAKTPAPPQGSRPTRVLGASEAFRPQTGGTVRLTADFDFDSFVVGPGNRLAYAASQAVSENPGRAYNPLFIHGGVGLGKTHLLQAICGRVLDENPRAMVHFDSCESFMNDFIESVKSGEMREFRHRFRDVDLLVIDDIHFLAKREHTQEEFFHTFNSLYAQKKQIVLSSDAPPEEIPDLENRLVSRFKWGLVATVEPPGFDTRVAILRKKAEMRSFDLPHQVAEYIAGRVTTNIRELEGAILTLQMVASVADRPIDIEMAREALGDQGQSAPVRVPTIDEIISAVCKRFDVKRTEILGKKRTRSITLPRHIAIYLARHLTRNSLQEIGGSFGGRDHTTVMHAIERAEVQRRASADLEATIRQLEEQLMPGGPPDDFRQRPDESARG